jgi:hypothetical protein
LRAYEHRGIENLKEPSVQKQQQRGYPSPVREVKEEEKSKDSSLGDNR